MITTGHINCVPCGSDAGRQKPRHTRAATRAAVQQELRAVLPGAGGCWSGGRRACRAVAGSPTWNHQPAYSSPLGEGTVWLRAKWNGALPCDPGKSAKSEERICKGRLDRAGGMVAWWLVGQLNTSKQWLIHGLLSSGWLNEGQRRQGEGQGTRTPCAYKRGSLGLGLHVGHGVDAAEARRVAVAREGGRPQLPSAPHHSASPRQRA